MRYKKKAVLIGLSVLMIMIALTGCGAEKKETVSGANYYYPKTETEQAEETTEISVKADFQSQDYMIMTHDMTKEYMVLKQMESGIQSVITYSLTTNFMDKYGNAASAASFECGEIIALGGKDSEGKLKSLQLSDRVWEYEDVIRYKIEEERGIFQIADTKYYFEEDLDIFSEGKKIALSNLKAEDKIKVIGMNKQILSIVVTTGQGSIALKNTELFEHSFIQIGGKIFAEITGEMELEVPEGSYIVSVANKGYGGSKEYEVKRGETTFIDLDELKGEGPKIGTITFQISTEDENTNAEIRFQIDGEEADYENPIELPYGVHSIKAESYGYETYAKKLFVNSETAVIAIDLGMDTSMDFEEEEELEAEEEREQEEGGAADTNLAGSLAGSTFNREEEGENAANTDIDTDALIEALTNALSNDSSTDYLSTLSGLLGNVLN